MNHYSYHTNLGCLSFSAICLGLDFLVNCIDAWVQAYKPCDLGISPEFKRVNLFANSTTSLKILLY